MKKLYTFLFTLLLSCAASAQITLTVDGVNVPDKATYTRLYDTDGEYKIPAMPMLGKNYGLYPHIAVTSQKAQDVVITITDRTHDRVQFCLAGKTADEQTCFELMNMNYVGQKTVAFEAGKARDLELHVMHDAESFTPYEVELQIDVYGTLDMKRVTSTVILRFDPDAANVGSLVVTTPSEYYTLAGQHVGQTPKQKGIYVKNGKKVVIR